MEMNRKLRGQKHHSNKVRYQNKAKVIPKLTPEREIPNKSTPKEQPERERGLTSNWHRYEESPEDDKIDESTNFAFLAQAPISQGGHFQFKSDKNAESEYDFETLRKNKMFALDLHLLELRLGTIPFQERCGLDENYLSKSQLEEINKRAHQNKAEYESYLKLNYITKDFLTHTVSDSKTNRNNDQSINKSADEDLETLLGTENKSNVEETADHVRQVNSQRDLKVNNSKESKDELEQWLEDILND